MTAEANNHDYAAFLMGKEVAHQHSGMTETPPLSPKLFPFQRDVTEFLLTTGRSAAFLDTGLGKTAIQLEWARVVSEDTGAPVLILAPLAVAPQTVREGEKFGIPARVVASQHEVGNGIHVTNYEKLDNFDPSAFAGIVLDESSILKSFAGKTTQRLIRAFAATPWRLACTATPAPNDHMELGNHAEFLGAMSMNDMLTRWFVHDSNDTKTWRLKGHARRDFWRWMASWSRCIAKPSDLGYDDDGFVLPDLKIHRHTVRADVSQETDGLLFRIPNTSATAIHKEKRLTVDDRAEVIADLVSAEPDEAWVIWCETDYEADALNARIKGSIEVRGSMPELRKVDRLVAFTEGRERVMITKPSIAGFGLNWQHCARVAFVGLSFSYEQFYQAVRRCWRFGQARDVHVHVAMADTERAIWDAVNRKSEDHDTMKQAMVSALAEAVARQKREPYNPSETVTWPEWLEGT